MSVDPGVFLHIGAPKTGTTYLQKVLAANRAELATQGLLYPGKSADHFLPAQDVMGHAFRGHADERANGTWKRLLGEIDGWDQSVLISHELFCLAGPDQIEKIMGDLGEHNVSVILTARDLVRQIPAVWQEDLKNGKAISLTDFGQRVQKTETKQNQTRGFWGYQHLPRILRRWERWISPSKIHVVTVPPPGSAPDLLWARYASTLGVAVPAEGLKVKRSNESLGTAEAEFLRLLNAQLADTMPWPEYRDRVKRGLVRRALSPGAKSRPIQLPPELTSWAAKTSTEMAEEIKSRGYQIVGDVADLVPSDERVATQASVDMTAVAEVGAGAVADLLVHRPRATRLDRGAAGPATTRAWQRVVSGLRGRRDSS